MAGDVEPRGRPSTGGDRDADIERERQPDNDVGPELNTHGEP